MRRRLAMITAVSLALALVTAPTAQAQVTTLYVRDTSTCTDSGTGTEAAPFCTVGAAAAVVEPGQVVRVDSTRPGPLVVTRSGTPEAPIVFEGVGSGGVDVPRTATTTGPTIDLSGVHDVVVRNLNPQAREGVVAVLVADSQRVTFDRGVVVRDVPQSSRADGVRVTGSSDVTISRNEIRGEGRAVHLQGGSDVTVTGNLVPEGTNPNDGVRIDGSQDFAFTGNTVLGSCDRSVIVAGASTGSVQNNVIGSVRTGVGTPFCSQDPERGLYGLEADAEATPGLTVDYNNNSANGVYVWGGTRYRTLETFRAETGQGQHDLNGHPSTDSEHIDSGNADAPGALAEARSGPRVDKPDVPNTGVGANSYTDRGAVEAQDSFTNRGATLSASQAPVGGQVTARGEFTSAWDLPFSCDIDFGDGTSTTVTPCTATHAFTAPGTYTVHFDATNAAGLAGTWDREITVVPAGGTLTAELDVRTTGGVSGEFTVDTGTNPWNVVSTTWDFGDHPVPLTTPYATATHRFHPGTHTVKVTVNDAGGNSASTQTTFTTAASGFVRMAPTRFLDTRTGNGTGGVVRKVAPFGTVRLAVGGRSGIPANATAVVMNLTAVRPTAGGYLTAHPDGQPRPTVSTVNFAAGQTVPNLAVVPIGTGGFVNLYNGSSGSTDMVADVTGYYTKATATDGFENEAYPKRLFDTRDTNSIEGGGTYTHQIPQQVVPLGATAVMLNVTAVTPTGDGYLTVYPNGSPRPVASNVNYVTGRTVANSVVVPLGPDGKVDFYALTRTHVVVDVIGYFGAGAAGFLVPATPVRKVDTRVSGGKLAGRGARVYTLADPVAGYDYRATGVVQNVTAVNATRGGYLLAYSAAKPNPQTSTLNYLPGTPVANLAATWHHQGAYYNGGDAGVDIVVDVSGYFYQR